MGELTESARQYLVSQGIVIGIVSVLNSLSLLLSGILAIARAADILHFTTLIHLAVLQLVCGSCSLVTVAFVWWTVVGYRNRQLEIRSKYLDDNLTKGLAALFIPVLLNYSAFIVSLVFLIVKTETTSKHEMKNAMSLYMVEMKHKIFIDKLQMVLKCCGSQSITDWFSIDWQNSESRTKTNWKNDTAWDSVPFSCCCPEVPPPCVHQQLRVFGLDSLHRTGCAEKLDRVVLIFVTASLTMFLMSSVTISLLMYSSRKLQTSARSAIAKGDATAPGAWWIFAPQYPSAIHPQREEEPLLGGQNSEDELCRPVNAALAEFCFAQSNFKHNSDALFQRSKFIDSTINEDWLTYNSASLRPEVDSSEDWPTRASNEASRSASRSSMATTAGPYSNVPDSRRSVSDTAIANLEVSHHFEHNIRPAYASKNEQ